LSLSFLLGFVAGFVVAAPVGAASILLVRRALHGGFPGAFAVGLGAAAGDTVFGALVIAGVGTILGFVVAHEAETRLVGGAILLAAAALTWRTPPRPLDEPEPNRGSLLGSAAAGFALTITNPITPAAFIMVFAALGLGDGLGRREMMPMTTGLFAGAMAWMGGLAWAASRARRRMTDELLAKTARWTSALLAVCGAWAILSVALR
jgi:threonine/homoserine/homoserine lactone efflux protein